MLRSRMRPARSTRTTAGPGMRGPLDSERRGERSCGVGEYPTQIGGRSGYRDRGCDLKARDGRAARAGRRRSSKGVFPHQDRGTGHGVLAGVVATNAGGTAGVLVMAVALSRRVRSAPRLAEHRSAGAGGEHEDDGEDSCSEHGRLVGDCSKSGASPHTSGQSSVFSSFRGAAVRCRPARWCVTLPGPHEIPLFRPGSAAGALPRMYSGASAPISQGSRNGDSRWRGARLDGRLRGGHGGGVFNSAPRSGG